MYVGMITTIYVLLFTNHVQIKQTCGINKFSLYPAAAGLISLIKRQAVICFPEQSNQLLQVDDCALMK